MALTKVSRGLLSTSIVDNGNATAITIDSSENVGIGNSSPVTLKSATTLQVSGNAKLGNDNGRGLLSLGDISSTGANVGIWRGAAGAYAGVGNYLNLGGYDGITFTTGTADIASQTERLRIESAGNLVKVGGVIKGERGTASAPAYSFSDDTDTGMFNIANAGLGFAVGGSERMRIDSSGNVQVKGGKELRVYRGDNATYGSMRYLTGSGGLQFDDKNSDGISFVRGSSAESMRIDASGNVGIGTSSPNSYAGQTALTINSTGVARLDLDINNAYQGYLLAEAGYIGLYAQSGNYISMGVSGVGEAMRIDASGNVGIGVSTPSNNHANANNLVVGNGTSGGIANYVGTGTGWYAFSRANANNSDAYDGGISYDGSRNLKFHTNAGSERMRIDSSGNVGIGTSSPSEKLHVNSGTGNVPALFQSTDSLALITFKDNSTSTDVGVGAQGNDQVFYAGSERMRIASTGAISVGSSTQAVTEIQLNHENSGGKGEIQLNSHGTASFSMLSNFTGSTISGVPTGSFGLITPHNHRISISTNGLERMRISASGHIGVFGSGATNERGDIAMTSGTGVSTRRWGFGGGTGTNSSVFYVINEGNNGVYLNHGDQGWTSHSDERIKENITDVGTVLPSLMNMRCVKYNLISNPTDTKIGFIAQDWESAFPEVVDENEHLVLEADGTIGTDENSDSTTPVKAMAYTETLPLLLKAIQEQQTLIESLTTRIAALEE